MTRGATEAQVKEAYFRKAKRFHPDAHHDAALSDLRGKLEAVFIRLGEAYEVLRNPRMRASYERGLGPPPAPARPRRRRPGPTTRLARRGVDPAERASEEKYWEAIQLLERAIPRVSGKIKQRAACCWRGPTPRTPTG